jgi:hypothetical protein
MSDPFERLIGRAVVLDTGTSIVYVGTLLEVTEHTFVLEQADIHDCRNGHASPESYIADAGRGGVTPNRNHIVVMRSRIMSVSALDDVIS